MGVIGDIANQTRYFALNAATRRRVPASRDVVSRWWPTRYATADMTTVSTEDIAATTKTMRESAGQAVASMEEAAIAAKAVARANDARRRSAAGASSAQAVGMANEIAPAVLEQRAFVVSGRANGRAHRAAGRGEQCGGQGRCSQRCCSTAWRGHANDGRRLSCLKNGRFKTKRPQCAGCEALPLLTQ